MKKKNRNYFIWLATCVVVIIATIFLVTRAPKPGKYDALARCLKTQGVIFYGTFWCPHCQSQKSLFGSSVQYLPYVECSTPDGQGQLPLCAQNKVSGYPTWVFKDNSRLTGETPLDQLAGKSGCPWPQ